MAVLSKVLVLPMIENIDEIKAGITTPVKIIRGTYKKIEIRVIDNVVEILHNGIDLREFDFVWLSSYWGSRDIAYAVKQYLEYWEVRHTYVEESTSKVTDQVSFSLDDISSPNTIYIGTSNIRANINKIEKICGYPLVVKDTKGSRGIYSALVNNRKELLAHFETVPKHRKFIFQEFIANDYDWGILIAHGKVVSAEKSYSTNCDFRNNACNGAKEVFVDTDDIPDEVLDIAFKACGALDLEWSRADIIVDKDDSKPYLLEVNRAPGITSSSSEVDAAQQFLNVHLDGLEFERKSKLARNLSLKSL